MGCFLLVEQMDSLFSTGIYSTTVPYGSIYTYEGAPDSGTWVLTGDTRLSIRTNV